jgi:hypothetical protein
MVLKKRKKQVEEIEKFERERVWRVTMTSKKKTNFYCRLPFK